MQPQKSSEFIQTGITIVSLLILVVLVWEGAKAFSRENGYALVLTPDTTIDLSNFNDQQLPHLGAILNSFMEPAQRNGPPLYQILFKASVFTLGESIGGFAMGAVLGFILAVIFTHSSLLQRGD